MAEPAHHKGRWRLRQVAETAWPSGDVTQLYKTCQCECPACWTQEKGCFCPECEDVKHKHAAQLT